MCAFMACVYIVEYWTSILKDSMGNCYCVELLYMNIIAIFCHSVELHIDWWSFYVFTWSDMQTFIDSQSACV